MIMSINEIGLPGCFEIMPQTIEDKRGAFVKTFHIDTFQKYNLVSDFAEEFYSVSYKGVLRGLHFQVPPKDHIKLVYCVFGEVMDVVVDLRVGSPTYGRYHVFNLSDIKSNILYIPSGLAHGFFVLSSKAVLIYKTTTVYSPEHDQGINWNYADIPWPNNNPVISERDEKLPTLAEYKSPFVFYDSGGE